MTDIYYDYDGNPTDHDTWSRLWDDTEARRLALDTVGGYRVSTVWLGVDHSFGHHEQPVLWETMVFSKGPDPYDLNEFMCRYDSRDEALAGHVEVVEMVRERVSGQ